MNLLAQVQFGDPILRRVARELTKAEILSPKTIELIKNMRYTLVTKKMGVGLAAPQVGKSLALSVIRIRPTKHRPKAEPYEQVIVNPKVIKTYGKKTEMWEGCLSAGESGLFAKVPRYKRVTVQFLDQSGNPNEESFDGLQAQVMQHEIDHLNGVLFMDHVQNPKTYMTLKEYKKHIVNAKRGK